MTTEQPMQQQLFVSDVRISGAIKRCARVLCAELPDGWALHKAISLLREAQAAALMADLEALAPEPRPEPMPDANSPA